MPCPACLVVKNGSKARSTDRLGHSGAGVGDGDLHVLPGAQVGILPAIAVVEIGVGGFDSQFAAVGHRIAGIDGEIEDRGFELGGIDFDRPDTAGADDFERHVFAERTAEKIGKPVEQPVDVDRGRIERLLPGERQQPFGQGRGALGAVHRIADALGEFQVRRIGPGFEQALRRLQIADDDGEQVVEIMGDAAGQVADGIELLRLPQRFLRREPLVLSRRKDAVSAATPRAMSGTETASPECRISDAWPCRPSTLCGSGRYRCRRSRKRGSLAIAAYRRGVRRYRCRRPRCKSRPPDRRRCCDESRSARRAAPPAKSADSAPA